MQRGGHACDEPRGPPHRNIDEHGAIEPAVSNWCPENRMQNIVPDFPTPIVSSPKRRRVVAARVDEFEILLIGDFELVDGKSGDVRRVGLVLIIPAKTLAAAFKAHRDHSPRAIHHLLRDRACSTTGRKRYSYLSI